jgi:hypothetical protein
MEITNNEVDLVYEEKDLIFINYKLNQDENYIMCFNKSLRDKDPLL